MNFFLKDFTLSASQIFRQRLVIANNSKNFIYHNNRKYGIFKTYIIYRISNEKNYIILWDFASWAKVYSLEILRLQI
jgi:hypothetical protein